MATVYACGVATAASGDRAAAAAPARVHIHYLENMRAVAILLVVASHCYGLAWSGTPLHWSPYDPVLSFISGATPVFVFLSGYFFHHVFGGEFRYARFLAKKARTLLPPYLTVTMLLLLVERAMGLDGMRYRIHDPIGQFAVSALTGGGGPAMWYVPFLFDMFLLSPLFLAFVRMGSRAQLATLTVLFVLGLAVDRGGVFYRLANVGHFSFYYALGILCSLNRERFEAMVRRPETLAISAGIVAVLAAAQYRAGLDLAAGLSVMWLPEKIVYIREIAMILLLAGVLLRIADRPVPGMTPIARWSFGIYFLHQLPLLLLLPIASRGWIAPGHGALAFYACLVFLLSLAFVWAARTVFGGNSRYLVGA